MGLSCPRKSRRKGKLTNEETIDAKKNSSGAKLYQNTPNPLTNQTTITYQLSKEDILAANRDSRSRRRELRRSQRDLGDRILNQSEVCVLCLFRHLPFKLIFCV